MTATGKCKRGQCRKPAFRDGMCRKCFVSLRAHDAISAEIAAFNAETSPSAVGRLLARARELAFANPVDAAAVQAVVELAREARLAAKMGGDAPGPSVADAIRDVERELADDNDSEGVG